MVLVIAVLIETLWNVKQEFMADPYPGIFCINRNIMECKGALNNGLLICVSVLIETLWNVKNATCPLFCK